MMMIMICLHLLAHLTLRMWQNHRKFQSPSLEHVSIAEPAMIIHQIGLDSPIIERLKEISLQPMEES